MCNHRTHCATTEPKPHFNFHQISDQTNFNSINKINMPPEKRITRAQFGVSCRTAKPPSAPTTPLSSVGSSNISTSLTPCPQITTFDNIIGKVFSKSLIASLTSKDAVLKDVRYCFLTKKEARLNELNTYIRSYWRNLHVRSGCVCIDKKIAIPNVFGKRFTMISTQATRLPGERYV